MLKVRVDKKTKVNHGGKSYYVGFARPSRGGKQPIFSLTDFNIGSCYEITGTTKRINGMLHTMISVPVDTRRVKFKKWE